jgi:hypothetical protein
MQEDWNTIRVPIWLRPKAAIGRTGAIFSILWDMDPTSINLSKFMDRRLSAVQVLYYTIVWLFENLIAN